MVTDIFNRLKSLQEILSRKYAIENEIRDIPKSLATKLEVVNRLKKSYIEKSENYNQLKQRILMFKENMGEAERLREKYEGQMDLIKTQREYEALDKEIRDASEQEQQFRKEVQKEEKNLEELKYIMDRDEQLIKEQEEELLEEQKAIEAATDDKKQLLTALEQEELTVIPGLDEEMLFKFERIIRSKAGMGIVPLKHGVCTGCHMILPMQFVNAVRQGDTIEFCPYCSRILFFQEEAEGDTIYSSIEAEGLFDLVDGDLDEDYDEDDLLDDEEESDESESGSDDDE